MKYKPYCWSGDEQDSHVIVFHKLEKARKEKERLSRYPQPSSNVKRPPFVKLSY